MTTAVTKDGYTMATQTNSEETPSFAFFSDTIRDAIKGGVFNATERGYVSGAAGKAAAIARCWMAQTNWSTAPTQMIQYASCHDNYTLYDKLAQSVSSATNAELVKMNNLAAAIYMTAQGIPFLQAGEEILRTKGGDSNSYASSDAVNSIKWDDLSKETHQNVYNYYKGLIAFRQAHPALRMTSAEEIAESITTAEGLDSNVNAFRIAAGANGEESDLFVIFNPNTEPTTVTLPEGSWTVYVNGQQAGTEPLGTAQGEVTVEAISAMVLVMGTETAGEPDVQEPAENNNGILIAAAVLAAAVIALFLIKKRKK